MHVLYLHGFASSAKSSKAAFFAQRLQPHGVQLIAPDFNEPDFEHLTVTRMIGTVRDTLRSLAPGPVALIGSSLGAFVAVHAAAAQARWSLDARIDRLVLLAPALDPRFASLTEAERARWRATDRLDVFHHAYGRFVPLRYALYEDARQYDSFALTDDLPTLIFQGRHDDAVDPAIPARWAKARPHVRVHLLDDGHQLLASLETIWPAAFSFLLTDHSSARAPAD